MAKPRAVAWALVAITWTSSLPAASLVRVSEGAFFGSVRDALGSPLPGVDIFLVPERIDLPAFSGQSGTDGTFSISSLPHGVYRILGFKPGYLGFRGRVNTLLRSSLDVLLLAAPGERSTDDSPVPKDPSWALRLP